MGFFDKAKQFMGGKGMADVAITVIERQPADNASIKFTDSVLKGTMVVTAKESCEVLQTKYEIFLRYLKDGQSFDTLVALKADPAPNTSYSDDFPKFPVHMTVGQSFTMPFLVHDVDVAAAMRKNGIQDGNAAVNAGVVSLMVRCIADVKGSPFDPSSEASVRLLPQ